MLSPENLHIPSMKLTHPQRPASASADAAVSVREPKLMQSGTRTGTGTGTSCSVLSTLSADTQQGLTSKVRVQSTECVAAASTVHISPRRYQHDRQRTESPLATCSTKKRIHFPQDSSNSPVTKKCFHSPQDSCNSPIAEKRVHFPQDSSISTVHTIVAWKFAYQAARKGIWEQYARNRAHFRRRIENLASTLEPCLTKKLDKF